MCHSPVLPLTRSSPQDAYTETIFRAKVAAELLGGRVLRVRDAATLPQLSVGLAP